MTKRFLSIIQVSFVLLACAAAFAQQPNGEATAPAGNAERGRAIVQGKGGCLACHRVRDSGSHMGPDLSSVGLDRTASEIRKELLYPRLTVEPKYQLYQVTTRDGQTITGRLMNQDRTSIQLLDSTDRLRSFMKENLSKFGFINTPAMPSYRTALTPAEQADLIAYLMTLKGVVRQ